MDCGRNQCQHFNKFRSAQISRVGLVIWPHVRRVAARVGPRILPKAGGIELSANAAFTPVPQGTSFVPYNLVISPDGQRLAFVAAGPDGETGLWIRSLAAGNAEKLSGTEGALFPFWSGDSRQIGFFAEAR